MVLALLDTGPDIAQLVKASFRDFYLPPLYCRGFANCGMTVRSDVDSECVSFKSAVAMSYAFSKLTCFSAAETETAVGGMLAFDSSGCSRRFLRLLLLLCGIFVVVFVDFYDFLFSHIVFNRFGVCLSQIFEGRGNSVTTSITVDAITKADFFAGRID